MLRDHTLRLFQTRKLAKCGHQTASNGVNGNVLDGRRLTEGNLHRRHGLATVLTTVMVRRAPGLAALHSLFGRGHANAIERIARESDD